MPRKKQKKILGIALPAFDDKLCCILVLATILGGLFMTGNITFNPLSPVPTGDTTTTTTTTDGTTTTTTTTEPEGTTVYHIQGSFEWEDDRHDVEIGDQMVWLEVHTSTAEVDHLEMEHSNVLYLGLWEYSFTLGESITLEFDGAVGGDWVFHDGAGVPFSEVSLQAGYTSDFYFYEIAEQWNYGIIHITWHTHTI